MAWDKKAVAGRDPVYRLGAVVVAIHSREWAAGQVVDVTLKHQLEGRIKQ